MTAHRRVSAIQVRSIERMSDISLTVVIHHPFPHIHQNGEPSFLVAAFCWFLYLLTPCFGIVMLNRTAGSALEVACESIAVTGSMGETSGSIRVCQLVGKTSVVNMCLGTKNNNNNKNIDLY